MVKSRLERLLETLGEENLPPRLPTPPQDEPEPEPDTTEDAFDVYKSQEYRDLPHANPEWAECVFNDKVPRAPELPPNPPKRFGVAQSAPLAYDSDEPFTFDQDKSKTAALGIQFCPFVPITQYCYRFVPKNWTQPLATAFFDAEKIYQRNWTLYYISSDYTGVVAFVTRGQVQTLLDEINLTFPEANIQLPDWADEEGLLVDFDDCVETHRPRLAGNCNSRGEYRSCLFALDQEPKMSIPTNGDRSLEAFKKKMEAVAEISKKKKKGANAKRHQEALVKRQDMVRQSLRAQRYLGLHPKNDSESLMPEITSLTISAIDPDQPAPYQFEDEPIFISIDCEAWEDPPRMVTEVGVATLDTRDLKGVPPGAKGENWHQFVRGRHFRVSEHENKVNHKYVQGCPRNFEFGASEWVGKRDLSALVETCFRQPYSKRVTKEDFSSPGAQQAIASSSSEARNLILVGHDVTQDIEYLDQIGFHVLKRAKFIDTVDTVNLYKTYNQDPNARALGTILADLDLPGWYLHNAGNDAVYTVHAMLAMCVNTAAQRGTGEAEKRVDDHQTQRTEAAVEGARERAKEDAEGWEADGDDGGVGVPPAEVERARLERKAAARAARTGLYTMGGAPLDV